MLVTCEWAEEQGWPRLPCSWRPARFSPPIRRSALVPSARACPARPIERFGHRAPAPWRAQSQAWGALEVVVAAGAGVLELR